MTPWPCCPEIFFAASATCQFSKSGVWHLWPSSIKISGLNHLILDYCSGVNIMCRTVTDTYFGPPEVSGNKLYGFIHSHEASNLGVVLGGNDFHFQRFWDPETVLLVHQIVELLVVFLELLLVVLLHVGRV